MKATARWLSLLAGATLGACAATTPRSAPTPAAGAVPSPTAPTALDVDVGRSLGEALARLGGDAASIRVESTAEGVKVEPAPSPLDLGAGLATTSRAPKRAELDAVFGQHCRLRGEPQRDRHEGFTRFTYRGVARRSGAECTLVADLPKEGRWRFVLRIRRHVEGS